MKTLQEKLKQYDNMEEVYDGHKEFMIKQTIKRHNDLLDMIEKSDNTKISAVSHILKNFQGRKKYTDLSIFHKNKFDTYTELETLSHTIVSIGTDREQLLLLLNAEVEVIGSYDEEMKPEWFDVYCESPKGGIIINLKKLA